MIEKTNFQMLSEIVETYSPADFLITSKEEVDMLKSHFHMDEMDVLALHNLRDFVVLYYSSLLVNKELEDRRSFYSSAMSSIVAVIDNVLWNRGIEV